MSPSRRLCLFGVLAFGVLSAAIRPLQASSSDLCTAPPNPIVAENCKPGNADWLASAYSVDIAGYASATSVRRGETLDLFVTTNTNIFDLRVYRTGYYGGAGARLVKSVSGVAGRVQPPCPEDAATGTTSCRNWKASYSLTVPDDWVSGIYVVRLTRPGRDGDNYIQFAVRDDASRSDILYQQSVTTYQAYNNYGGKSLYESNSSGCFTIAKASRAAGVSFDRPYNARLDDPHNYVYTEYPMVRWLEAQGYDVSYSTDLDTHRSGRSGAANALLQHRVFLISGHDEYWSPEMRAAVTAARQAGVHLAVFSANTGYWKVRMTPSASGVPDRVMVSYKTAETLGSAVDPAGSTSTWRDPAGPNEPENALVGVQYIGDNDTLTFPLRVNAQQGRDRVYRHTDLQTLREAAFVDIGQHLVGWEWDAVAGNGHSPKGLEVVAESPVLGALLTGAGTESERSFRPALVHAVRQVAPNGSMLFNSGTIKWAWGLEWFEPNLYIQQVTYNVLSDMGVRPATPAATLGLDSAATPVFVSSPQDRSAPLRAGEVLPPIVPELALTVLGTAVEIVWATKTPATGQVWLGTSEDYVNDIVGTDVKPGRQHVFRLAALEPNTRYYCRIVSVGSTGEFTLFRLREFKTGRATALEGLQRAVGALQPAACAVRPTFRPAWQWARLYPTATAFCGLAIAGLATGVLARRRRRAASISPRLS